MSGTACISTRPVKRNGPMPVIALENPTRYGSTTASITTLFPSSGGGKNPCLNSGYGALARLHNESSREFQNGNR